jgi:hypothetical protein
MRAKTPDNNEFRFEIQQRIDNRRVRTDLSGLVEQVEWSDSSDEGSLNSWPSLTGSITLRQPGPTAQPFPVVEPNQIVDCFLNGERLWRMRIVKPAYSSSDGSITLELRDEIGQLAMSTASFRFVKDKGHKYGWTPDQIARYTCDRFRIPYDSFFTVKYAGKPVRLTKLQQTTSPTGIIRAAYSEAQKRTAIRYVMRWNYATNALVVEPMQTSITKYEFTENEILDASSEVEARGDFATALLGVWWKPKPKGASKKWKPTKHTMRVVSSGTYKLRNGKTVEIPDGIIQKYGYIEKRVDSGLVVNSEAEARDRLVNSLATRLRPRKTLTFTTLGIPHIHRGDFITVHLPKQGFNNQQCWVQNIRHSLGDNYTMELTARFDNPMDAGQIRKEQDAARRYRANLNKKPKK